MLSEQNIVFLFISIKHEGGHVSIPPDAFHSHSSHCWDKILYIALPKERANVVTRYLDCSPVIISLLSSDCNMSVKWILTLRWQSHIFSVYVLVHFERVIEKNKTEPQSGGEVGAWRLFLGEFSPGLVCYECRMSPVYEMLTALSCLPDHEPLLLLHWRPLHSSWPPNSTPKTWLKKAAMGGTGGGGGKWRWW